MATRYQTINRLVGRGRFFWHSVPKSLQYAAAARRGFGMVICVVLSLLVISGHAGAIPLDRALVSYHDAVFVLDNSASMQKVDPDFLLKRVVERFVAATEGHTRVGVVLFDERARLVFPLTSLDGASQQHLGSVLERLDYRGVHSDLPRGIERALYELRSYGRRKATKSVLLVTDGILDIGDAAEVDEVVGWLTGELAAQAAAEGIGIFGVALSERAHFRLFQSLAHATGADYFRASSIEGVFPILEQIGERLHYPVWIGSSDPLMAPVVAALPASLEETTSTNLPSPAPVASSVSFTDKLVAISPLGEKPVRPLLLGVADLPSRSFIWVSSVVSLVLVALALAQFGRRRERGRTVANANGMAPSGDRVPRAFLYDLSGATDSPLHDVSNRVTVIGRLGTGSRSDESCAQLLIDEPTVSRRHAVIEYRQHGFWLIDQRSRNGTYLGGQRVRDAVCLKHNDRITFSTIDFEFHVAAMDEAAETILRAA